MVSRRTAQRGTEPCVGSFELTAPTRILAEIKAFVQQLDNFELLFLLIQRFSFSHSPLSRSQTSMISHVGAPSRGTGHTTRLGPFLVVAFGVVKL
jgi:hypothetical protein